MYIFPIGNQNYNRIELYLFVPLPFGRGFAKKKISQFAMFGRRGREEISITTEI